jgi:alpha-tubulin suppressor-like RCC1 family protein
MLPFQFPWPALPRLAACLFLLVRLATTAVAMTAGTEDPSPRSQSAPGVYPAVQYVLSGEPATLSVTVSGDGPFAYQWYHYGRLLSGATSATYTIPTVTQATAGDYHVAVTRPAGTIYLFGGVFLLEVPTIQQHPVGGTFIAGSSPTLRVESYTLGPVTYRWHRNGSLVAETNEPFLVLDNITLEQAGGYQVEMVNRAGSATSQTATVGVVPPAGVLSLVAGGGHSLMLRADGRLFGMGKSRDGALPPSFDSYSYRNWNVPVLVAENVVQVAAGSEHSVWITQDGTLWGQGFAPAIGAGAEGIVTSPVMIAQDVVRVVAGSYHTFFIRRDGTLWAVGYNTYGQLGDGTTTLRLQPVQVAERVIAVAAGGLHSLLIRTDGSLWATGYGAQGALGTGGLYSRTSWTQVEVGVKAIAAGFQHSLFVKNDDSLWAMGANGNGQLGLGTRTDSAVPVQVAASVNLIAAGGDSSIFTRHNGTTWAMGYSVGAGAAYLSTSPVQISEADIAALHIDNFRLLQVRSDGSAWASGENGWGEFGLGASPSFIAEPARITGGSGSAPVAPTNLIATDDVYSDSVLLSWNAPLGWGRFEVWRNTSNDPATAALLAQSVGLPLFEDRAVTTGVTYHYWIKAANPWGTSAFSGSDTGRASSGSPPVIVTPPTAQTALAGTSVTFTATVTGTLPLNYQWHFNGEPIPEATGASHLIPRVLAGHAGDYSLTVTNIAGTATSTAVALTVPGPAAVMQVATGQGHSLFVRADGTLWAAGGNVAGQLGDGTTESRSEPVQVATGVITAFAGRLHSFYLQANGSLWGMGSNSYGELGAGPIGSVVTPTLIMTDVVKVATHDSATLFLKRDGSLWASGGGTWAGQTVFASTTTPVRILEGVRDMAIGAEHMAVVMANGELRTAGRNSSGQLGDGTDYARANLMTVLEGVVAVAAGAHHTAALRFDGALWTFGSNSSGQLGDGTITSRATPMAVATGVQRMYCGYNSTYFFKPDDSLWSMGSRSDSAFSPTSDRTPVLRQAAALSVAGYWAHALFALPDGTVQAVGNNGAGQLGGGSIYGEPSPIIVHAGVFPRPEAVRAVVASDGTLPGLVRITWDGVLGAAGYEVWRGTTNGPDALLARTTDPYYHDSTPSLGSGAHSHYWVRAFNPGGQSDFDAGDAGAPGTLAVPVIVAQSGDVRSFVGLSAVLSIVAEGEGFLRYQWYRNGETIPGATRPTFAIPILQSSDDGSYTVRVSNPAGSVDSVSITLRVTVPEGVLRVAAGPDHSLFLRSDGSLWGMGYAASGRLPANLNEFRVHLPRLIATDVVAMAAGGMHTLFVTGDGRLWAMGDNRSGQLGDGTTTNRAAPVLIATEVAAVAAGSEHSLYIRKDGSLWGTGSQESPRTPVKLLDRVVAIAAGERHSVALKDDGTVWTAGYYPFGALGRGFGASTTWGEAATGATAVAAGSNHTLFLKADGTVWAMGDNRFGQLGNGTTQGEQGYAGVFSPIQVGAGFRGVTAGGNTSLLTKTDGTVWATGANAGLYGNGTTANSSTPVQVFAGNPATVSTGGSHQLMALGDGSLRTAGANFWGQLGDGTEVSRPSGATVAAGDLVAPLAPTQVNAYGTPSGSGVRVTWRAPVGSQHYEVWRGTSADFALATMVGPRVPLPTFLDTTAQPSVRYHYWIKAANPAGVSAPSASAAGSTDEIVVLRIDMQPLGPTAVAGTTVTLSVDAIGPAPLSYQWRKNGEIIPGANAATLVLEDVTLAVAGDYDVVVSNAAGSTTSGVASLAVQRLGQGITFAPLPNRAYTATPLTLSATASSGLPVAFTLLSGPAGLQGSQLTLLGTGTVSIRVSQDGDERYSAAPHVEQSFTVLPSFESWMLDHFEAEQIANPALTGPNADFDGDGLSNLLEYALGLDPKVPGTSGLPAAGRTATHWTYTYTRPAARSDVSYVVESSTNLTSWSTANVTLTRIATGETETWQATVPTSAGNNLFFRLRVTR